jgi:hypothetical protein
MLARSQVLQVRHLAKLLKSVIYIHRVSAERIGLGRESGLADDLLPKPDSEPAVLARRH